MKATLSTKRRVCQNRGRPMSVHLSLARSAVNSEFWFEFDIRFKGTVCVSWNLGKPGFSENCRNWTTEYFLMVKNLQHIFGLSIYKFDVDRLYAIALNNRRFLL